MKQYKLTTLHAALFTVFGVIAPAHATKLLTVAPVPAISIETGDVYSGKYVVKNTGTEGVNIRQLSANYPLTLANATSCVGVLPTGAQCELPFNAQSTYAGTFSSVLNVSSDATSVVKPSVTTTVLKKGVSLSQTNVLSFENNKNGVAELVARNTSKFLRTLKLSNVYPSNVKIGFSGCNAVGDTITLNPGQVCTIMATVADTVAGANKLATLNFSQAGTGIQENTPVSVKYSVIAAKVAKYSVENTACSELRHAESFSCTLTLKNNGELEGKPEVKNLWIKNSGVNYAETNIINNCNVLKPGQTCAIEIKGLDTSKTSNWLMTADVVNSDQTITPYSYSLSFKVPTFKIQPLSGVAVPFGETKNIDHVFTNTSTVPLRVSTSSTTARVGANVYSTSTTCDNVLPGKTCIITDTIDRTAKPAAERSMDTYYTIGKSLTINYGENYKAELPASYSITGQLSKEVIPATFIGGAVALGTTNVFASQYSTTVALQNKGSPAVINSISLPATLNGALQLDPNSSCRVGNTLTATCLLTVKVYPDKLESLVGQDVVDNLVITYDSTKKLTLPIQGGVAAATVAQEGTPVFEDLKPITAQTTFKVSTVPASLKIVGITSDPEGKVPHPFLSVPADTAASTYPQNATLSRSVTAKAGMPQGNAVAYLKVEQKGMAGDKVQTIPFKLQVVESIIPKGSASLSCDTAFTSESAITCQYTAKNTGKIQWPIPVINTIKVQSATPTTISESKVGCTNGQVLPGSTCTMSFKVNANTGLFSSKSINLEMGAEYSFAKTTATLIDRGLTLVEGSRALKAQVGESVNSVFTIRNTNAITVPLKLAAYLKTNNWLTIANNSCGSSLESGKECSISVVCKPVAGGLQQNGLTLKDLPDLSGTEIGLSCEGLPPSATITPQNTNTSIPVVGENTKSGNWFTFTNTGVGPVSIKSLNVKTANSSWKLYVENTGKYCYPGKVINGGETCNVLTSLVNHSNSGQFNESFNIDSTAGVIPFNDMITANTVSVATTPVKGSTGDVVSSKITIKGSAYHDIAGITVKDSKGALIAIPSTCVNLPKNSACQIDYPVTIGATSQAINLQLYAKTFPVINGIANTQLASDTSTLIGSATVPVAVLPPAVETVPGAYEPMSEGQSGYAVHLVKNNGIKALAVGDISVSAGTIHRKVRSTCSGSLAPNTMCSITTEALGIVAGVKDATVSVVLDNKPYNFSISAKVLPEVSLSARALSSSQKIEPGKNAVFTYYVYNQMDKAAPVNVNINTTPQGASIASSSALRCTSSTGNCNNLTIQGNTLKGSLLPNQVLTISQSISAGGAEGTLTGSINVDPVDSIDRNMADNKASAVTKVGLYEGDLYVYVQGSNNLYNTGTTQTFTYTLANMGTQTSQAKFKLGMASSKGLKYTVGNIVCTQMDAARSCPNGKSAQGEYVITLNPGEAMEIATQVSMPSTTDDAVISGEITPVSFKDPTLENNVYKNYFKVVDPMLDLAIQLNNTPVLKYVGDTVEFQYLVRSASNLEAHDAVFNLTNSAGLTVQDIQCVSLMKNAKCYTAGTQPNKFWANFPYVGSTMLVIVKAKATGTGTQFIQLNGMPDSTGPGRTRSAQDNYVQNNTLKSEFQIINK